MSNLNLPVTYTEETKNKYAIVRIKHEKKLIVVRISNISEFSEHDFLNNGGDEHRYNIDVQNGENMERKRCQVVKIGGNLIIHNQREFNLPKYSIRSSASSQIVNFLSRLFVFDAPVLQNQVP